VPINGITPERPNIVIIYVDDLGYGDLGSYGHPVLKTPSLDKLASQGVRLTNYYAPSPLCSPSRAALLTGRHPYRTGIKSWIPTDSGIYLPEDEVTLAEVLREVGYANALVGKWHLNSNLGNANEPQPLDQGFDYAYGHNAFQLPTNKDPVNVYRNGRALPKQKGYTAQLYADDAIRWLKRRDPQKPFFLLLSMAEPHTSIENPPQWNRRYRQFTKGTITPIPSGLPAAPKHLLTPRGPGEYYANISFMDHHIGRVLKTLDRLKLRNNTVVVFASDNGAVTSHWINWWEVGAYGSTGGTGTDIFTTLIKLAFARLPKGRAIDGVDAMPAWQNKPMSQRTHVWSLEGQDTPPFAVRRDGWKLLLDSQQQAHSLFNLADDPLELFDLLSAEPKRAAGLQQEFRQLHESYLTRR